MLRGLSHVRRHSQIWYPINNIRVRLPDDAVRVARCALAASAYRISTTSGDTNQPVRHGLISRLFAWTSQYS